jgi:predicted AlkP superfamily phosphohydrolase/phosphomutase
MRANAVYAQSHESHRRQQDYEGDFHEMTTLIRALMVTALLALTACGETPRTVDQRLIILGFDGMDPNLARQWMADGSLPNFSRLAEMGQFKPLATSNPPQSPVAWSDFATGEGPGEHGIYDFLRRDPETYGPAFSISENIPPETVLDIFGMQLPLDDAQILNRRQGTPFWSQVEAEGGDSTVLRVPVTFPPDPIHRMLAGMGVPDLLGSQGTYTLYTTQPTMAAASSSTRAVRIRPDRKGVIKTQLEGPAHPLKPEEPPMNVPLNIQPDGDGILVSIDEQDLTLAPGQWSDWVNVRFRFLGFASVSGMVRLYLVNSYPRVQLYVSPIHIDPREPVVPLSSPPEYAGKLAEDIGMYHTLGMPEETWSLNEGHLSDSAYLEMIRTILAEREAMFYNALDQHDSDVVVGVFVQTDRVSHMFYRGMDTQHPLYDETDEEARGAIHWIYREADRVLGETMQRMGPNDRLIVLSDHGFAPFRWAVNLNRWLADEGLLVMKDDATESGVGFVGVDWSRSKAYAIGLNSVFINRAGREANGIVSAEEAERIKRQIIERLPTVFDANTGEQIVAEVFDGAEVYPGNANGDAPDLVIGYNPGYRASWQTTLGGVPGQLIEANARKWSGDHCMLPDAVPGVLFTSFTPEQPIEAIADVARYARENWPGAQ